MFFFKKVIFLLILTNLIAFEFWYYADDKISWEKIENLPRNLYQSIWQSPTINNKSSVSNLQTTPSSYPSSFAMEVISYSSSLPIIIYKRRHSPEYISNELKISPILQQQILCISFPQNLNVEQSLALQHSQLFSRLPQNFTAIGRIQINGDEKFLELISPLSINSFSIKNILPQEMPNNLTLKKPITLIFDNAEIAKNALAEIQQIFGPKFRASSEVIDSTELLLLPKTGQKLFYFYRAQEKTLIENFPQIWANHESCDWL